MIAACLWMFLGGLAGSAHCIGMCGGFAASIGARGASWRAVLPRQIVYSLGRITTYAFLGMMAATLGARFASLDVPIVGAQRLLAVVSGAVMVLIGLHTLGVWRMPRAGGAIAELFAPFYRYFLNRPAQLTISGAIPATSAVTSSSRDASKARGTEMPRPSGSLSISSVAKNSSAVSTALGSTFMAGLFTGFLPCGLVYAFLAWVMTTHDALTGLLGMAAFGVGTSPGMIAIGCGAALLGTRFRSRIFQFTACIMLALGLVTVYRGIIRPGACHESGAGPTAAATCCHEAAP